MARQVKAATVVVPFFGNSLIEVEKELDQAIEVLADLVDAAEEAGVVLGIESTLNFNQCKYLLGQFAHTEYRVLKQGKAAALLEVKLLTGRKNQIRVHLSGEGHAIVGDSKYGRPQTRYQRLALHAASLCFPHPVTGKKVLVETGLPDYFFTLVGNFLIDRLSTEPLGKERI